MVLDFNLIEPFQSAGRVNLSDDGQVLARYGDANYRDDGSNGQVMVRWKKFYYRAEHGPLTHDYYTSPVKRPGYRVFPRFVVNGVEAPEIYIGAYKACAYDVSEGTYCLDDSLVADVTVGTGDKLSSIAGAKPISGLNTVLTLPNARRLAQNRGPGWGLVDFLSHSMIQMLMLVELSHFNAQALIGSGVTSITDDGSTNMSMPTGQTASLGNASGAATGNVHYATGQPANSISYRGLEDWWGNGWEWMDGINISNYEAWVADHGYQSDLFGPPYAKLGPVPNVSGYIADIAPTPEHDYHFLPSQVGSPAGANSRLCDYYYNPGAAANRAALRGGTWTSGSTAGPRVLALILSAGDRYRTLGARLLYVGGA